eukprot:1564473-Rhodomonas_salina.1
MVPVSAICLRVRFAVSGTDTASLVVVDRARCSAGRSHSQAPCSRHPIPCSHLCPPFCPLVTICCPSAMTCRCHVRTRADGGCWVQESGAAIAALITIMVLRVSLDSEVPAPSHHTQEKTQPQCVVSYSAVYADAT